MAAHTLALVFGMLGNIISFCVYLAPLPTFYRIYKKKSTEGFQSIPYAVALFSAMLLLYYGYIKPDNRMMLITINSLGCTIETAYIIVFLIYATKESLKYTIKLFVLFNVVTFGLIVSTTFLLSHGSLRVNIVGWICAIFSVCVFAAPLSIMRLVIKTKSIEYMPFSLSFCLTLCAVMWFGYGLLIKDYFIATPNVLGFGFGVAQMGLYVFYRDKKKQIQPIAGQPKEIPAATVVDLEAILEMQEKGGANLGAILELQEKAGVDLGVVPEVILEMQEKSELEAQVDADKQKEMAKSCSAEAKLAADHGIMPTERAIEIESHA